jgi:hypothetical protein
MGQGRAVMKTLTLVLVVAISGLAVASVQLAVTVGPILIGSMSAVPASRQ